ncbi:hypothetical protein AWE51_22355 [Aquimarina aggregata]|uniref:Glycosyltransferase 2-like domain-containing protein n=1 Tax=Aquimarina aggregata TaxID=1642818 RepID=A0A162DJN5_9FLAO|nr:glycosyltransferase [Aquimarina aggregata]KZS41448.1 hypothetical protein AWE51_22355 [Aquimarina aggregata]
MNNIVAFVSVIFPNNLKYFDSFLESLDKQTFKKFDLLLFNDGCANDDLLKRLQKYNLRFEIKNPKSKIPVLIRSEILNYIKEAKYELIVFGDTDDMFSKNRIFESYKMIKEKSYDIVFNDLSIINDAGNIKHRNFWNERFVNGKLKVDFDFLSNYNVLGLGNSAMRTHILKGFVLKIDISIPAFDWILFLQLFNITPKLLVGFSNEETFYRQHDQNTLGLSNKIGRESLKKLYNIKSKVYDFCKLHGIRICEKKVVEHERFGELILNDNNHLDNHLDKINTNKNKLFWFEEVTL